MEYKTIHLALEYFEALVDLIEESEKNNDWKGYIQYRIAATFFSEYIEESLEMLKSHTYN